MVGIHDSMKVRCAQCDEETTLYHLSACQFCKKGIHATYSGLKGPGSKPCGKTFDIIGKGFAEGMQSKEQVKVRVLFCFNCLKRDLNDKDKTTPSSPSNTPSLQPA